VPWSIPIRGKFRAPRPRRGHVSNVKDHPEFRTEFDILGVLPGDKQKETEQK
jgi:hypothetical protein